MLFKTASRIFRRGIKKKLIISENLLNAFPSELKEALIISTPSAWAHFKKTYQLTSSDVILDHSLQFEEIKKSSTKINNPFIIGIGGGRAIDIAKALAKIAKKSCYVIPTILSTTAWLNPGASLKKDKYVHHAKGRIDKILIDPILISKSPQDLNLGGLADIICGYNSASDWILANEMEGERLPKKAIELILKGCESIRENFKLHKPITPKNVPFYVNSFINAMALCWGLLSGRPVEGSEHFLYYALEESYNKPMNHGSIIALNTLVCLLLRGDNALIAPDVLRGFFEDLHIPYRLSELGIPLEIYKTTLEMMNSFCVARKLQFSIWNLPNPFENCSIDRILKWIE